MRSKKRILKPIVALGAIFIVSFTIKEFGYNRENVEPELDDVPSNFDWELYT